MCTKVFIKKKLNKSKYRRHFKTSEVEIEMNVEIGEIFFFSESSYFGQLHFKTFPLSYFWFCIQKFVFRNVLKIQKQNRLTDIDSGTRRQLIRSMDDDYSKCEMVGFEFFSTSPANKMIFSFLAQSYRVGKG